MREQFPLRLPRGAAPRLYRLLSDCDILGRVYAVSAGQADVCRRLASSALSPAMRRPRKKNAPRAGNTASR